MKADDLYGSRSAGMEKIREAVEEALGVVLLAQRNDYRGFHYTLNLVATTGLVLQLNWDPLDGELMEEAFPDMRVLLYVYGAEQPRQIEAFLCTLNVDLVLLRREWV